MRQRAELVGGRVVAERAGSGWRVEAEVPLHGAAEAP
jgi:signal transduction histidine kinase